MEELTRAERRLRLWLWLHAGLSALFILGYLAEALFGGAAFAYVVNSVTKDALLVALSVLAAADVRRRGWLTYLIVGALLVLAATNLLMILLGGRPPVTLPFGIEIPARAAGAAWMAADLALAALFGWLVHRALRERHGLAWFGPVTWPTFVALADVIVEGPAEPLGPEDIGRKVDGYLAKLGRRSTLRIRGAFLLLTLLPVFWARLPPALMSHEARLAFLKRRFVADVAGRRLPRLLAKARDAVQAAIRAASQFTYLGFYGDSATHPRVGYKPYSERAPEPPQTKTPDLEIVEQAPPEADVVVIGSGAAGSIAAYRLAEAGRRVLVLERGPYVRPREFEEDEVGMYLRLYNEGALTLARDFRLQVLQGMCVGGSTVVNNAVCFDPPESVLEAWADRGIDADGLTAGVQAVRRLLKVSPAPASAFSEGALRLGGDVVELNAQGCLGCGYCNIGCRFGRKLSALDAVLPEGQAAFKGRLAILPEFRVARIEHQGGRAGAVVGADGTRIRARTVVLAAGALASSWILQRSGLGRPRVGEGVHFNVNSPLTAEFPDAVDTFDGLQMSHSRWHDGALIETWFNPPATQALAMPGWFEDHDRNMRRYRYMACGGVLVGTTTPGSVRAGRRGPKLDFKPSQKDLGTVVDGLQALGRLYLDAGACKVMPATYAYHEFTEAAQLGALDGYVRDNSDLMLTTAHPQGGNAVGSVLDADFRVRGTENLHVCDASAFPSSVTVNPQLTVMGLAHHAAGRIA